MIGYSKAYGLLLWMTLLASLVVVSLMATLLGFRILVHGVEQSQTLPYYYVTLGFASIFPAAVYCHKAIKFKEEISIDRWRDWITATIWCFLVLINLATAATMFLSTGEIS